MHISCQNCAATAFGTRNVQLPPLAFRGSSHTGFTPRWKRCMLSRSASRVMSKLLSTDQNCLTSVIDASGSRRSSYLLASSAGGLESVTDRSCRSCQKSQPCTSAGGGASPGCLLSLLVLRFRRARKKLAISAPRAGELFAACSSASIPGRPDIRRRVGAAILVVRDRLKMGGQVVWIQSGSRQEGRCERIGMEWQRAEMVVVS